MLAWYNLHLAPCVYGSAWLKLQPAISTFAFQLSTVNAFCSVWQFLHYCVKQWKRFCTIFGKDLLPIVSSYKLFHTFENDWFMYIFHLFIHWLEGNLCVRYDKIYHKTCLVIKNITSKTQENSRKYGFSKSEKCLLLKYA